MPRFWSPGGPHIPDEVDRALEDERLVLFCGAGVSMAAGLPDFRGLVKKLYKGLNQDAPPEGDKQWDWPDRLLGQLERDHPGNFRQKLHEILIRKPKKLGTHESIIQIARLKDQRVRLVTTNFDLYFEKSWRSLGYIVEEHEGPALPIPQPGLPHDWGSIVYLHGKLRSRGANSHLVVTSADFGRAYLREGWAARFATHLLSSFSVLFIGYSLNDPVLRYIVDAFAADRAAGRVPHQAYALVGTPSARREDREQWAGMEIQPIYYDDADGHRALHETLRTWAEWRKDRLTAKERAIEVALQAPGTAVMPPDVRANLLWAVAGSGPEDQFGAAVLATRAAEAPGEWITVFEDHDTEVQRQARARSDSGQATLLARLVGAAETTTQPSPVEVQMARWIVAHLDDRSVLDWARRRWNAGHRIGALLRGLVRRELLQKPPPSAFATLWRILSAEALQPQAVSGQVAQDVLRLLRQNRSLPELRGDICWLLEPVLVLDDPFYYSLVPGTLHAHEQQLSDLVSPRIELRGSHWLDALWQDNTTRPDQAILGAMTEQLTGLLGRALDLWAALGRASAVSDPGINGLRLLGTPMLYRATEEWTLLADLLWAGWKQRDGMSASASRALVAQWQAQPYPMFRGLALMAVTKSDHWDADQKVCVLLNEITAPYLSHQILPLIAVCWPNISQSQQYALAHAVLAIKPDQVSDGDARRAEGVRDYVVLLRLAKIDQCMAGSLPAEAMTELARLRGIFPEFSLEQFEQAGLPKLPGTAFAPLPVSFSPAKPVCSRTEGEILDLLREQERHAGVAVIDWQTSWQKCPDSVFLSLELARTQDIEPAAAWAGAVRNVPSSLDEADAGRLFMALIGLPDALLTEPRLLRDASRFLADRAKWGHAGGIAEAYWALWDKLIAKSAIMPINLAPDDPFANAVLNPGGALAEALIAVFNSTRPKRRQLLTIPWRPRFDTLIGNGHGFHSARVVLSRHLAFLHSVDSEWTIRNILRRMEDWALPHSEAVGLWNAYGLGLHLDIELWNDLRGPFTTLVCDNHLDSLDAESRRNLVYVPVILVASFLDLACVIADTRRIVAALQTRDRDEIALWMRRTVEHVGKAQPGGEAGAQSRVDDLVYQRILPWLEAVWPQQQQAHTDDSTRDLICVALGSGSVFPNVSARVRPFLGKLRAPVVALMCMQHSRHPDEHPAALFRLIDHVADPANVTSIEPLGDILARAERNDASLADDPAFRRWKERLRVLRSTQNS